MFGRLAPASHIVAHEIADKLSAGAVMSLRGIGKGAFQSFIDPESESGFAHA